MFFKTQLSYPTEHAHFATLYFDTPWSVCRVPASCDLIPTVRMRNTANDRNSQEVDHWSQEGEGRRVAWGKVLGKHNVVLCQIKKTSLIWRFCSEASCCTHGKRTFPWEQQCSVLQLWQQSCFHLSISQNSLVKIKRNSRSVKIMKISRWEMETT